MECPGCSQQMDELRLEATYGSEVELDVCHACHSFWFDRRESLQLSPGATLELFRLIHQKQQQTPVPIREAMQCPRCKDPLQLTHDLIGSTRFTYQRCPRGHGRQTTFFQFLKEKNLIKPLDARQLAQLRAQVKVIRCSNCGAPVELERSATCGHCQAAISALDPAQVEQTLQKLQQHDARRNNVDPNVAAQLIMDKLQTDSFYQRLDLEQPAYARRYGRRGGWGLVEAGVSALFGLLS